MKATSMVKQANICWIGFDFKFLIMFGLKCRKSRIYDARNYFVCLVESTRLRIKQLLDMNHSSY